MITDSFSEKFLRRFEINLLFTVTLFGVLLRLIEIRQPFVDAWSWRQADVAMIAENFYHHGFNIFYPQINWAGPSPGYVGTEFQIIAFIAALFYLLFGVQEWIGRSVSVFFFVVSVPFFYLLVRKVSNQNSALFAVGVYTLAPLSIFSGRSFMPDMASLSFSIIALYLFSEWLEREKNLWLFTATYIATSLAILVKLPAIIIGLPLLCMAWKKHGARLLLRRQLWAFAALCLAFPLAWYSHAYLISTSHFPYEWWAGPSRTRIISLHSYAEILHRTATSSLTPIVFAAMLVGVVLPPRIKFDRVFHWWLVAIVFFIFIAGRGNSEHPWYQLPIVPVAAAFAGLACDFVLLRLIQPHGSKLVLASACLSFFLALGVLSYVYIRPLYKPWGIPSLNAGIELDRIAPPDALVISADDGNPTTIYYSRRKGWHFPQGSNFSLPWPADGEQAITELEKLRAQGGSYLVFTKSTFYLLSGQYRDFQKHLDASGILMSTSSLIWPGSDPSRRAAEGS
jgi:Dolichyl-phosphate-mannose-protein mannosyltransferase